MPWAIYTSVKSISIFFKAIQNACQNKTRWETLKRNKIDYLKPFPNNYNPFDQGIVNNLKEFITMRKKRLIYHAK